MKKTEKFIVLRNRNTGDYIQNYKNNEGAFTFSAQLTSKIQDAATNLIESLEVIENDDQNIKALAQGLGCEILVVEAEYSFKTLDGNEPEDLTKSIEEAKKETFKNLLEMFVKNSEED